jgi:hypothetical protein
MHGRPSETKTRCGTEVGEETIAGSRIDPDLAEFCGVVRLLLEANAAWALEGCTPTGLSAHSGGDGSGGSDDDRDDK